MKSLIHVEVQNFHAIREEADIQTLDGHIANVRDAASICGIGANNASLWASTDADTDHLVAAKFDGVTYYSDAGNYGGWSSIAAIAAKSCLTQERKGKITIASLIYDVVDDHLNQYRVMHTWTADTYEVAYSSAGSLHWRSVKNPSSKTADEIQKQLFQGEQNNGA